MFIEYHQSFVKHTWLHFQNYTIFPFVHLHHVEWIECDNNNNNNNKCWTNGKSMYFTLIMSIIIKRSIILNNSWTKTMTYRICIFHCAWIGSNYESVPDLLVFIFQWAVTFFEHIHRTIFKHAQHQLMLHHMPSTCTVYTAHTVKER